MKPSDIGIVYNELRDRRVLFSEAQKGRRRTEGQREAVEILRNAAGRFEGLDSFLETQGMRLVVKEASGLGLGESGVIYVLVRDLGNAAPAHVVPNQIVTAMLSDRRSNETVEQLTIWCTFLTLTLLHFLYTRGGRPVEAVSAFKEAFVDLEEMVEEVHRRIGLLERTDCAGNGRQATIKEALTSLTNTRVDGRVKSFMTAMVSVGILTPLEGAADETGIGRDAWQQTLWSAVDIAENFYRYAMHLQVDIPAAQVQGYIEGDHLFGDESVEEDNGDASGPGDCGEADDMAASAEEGGG